MKIACVRLYQAVPVGQKLETFLTTDGGGNIPGLTLEWSKGLLKIEAKALTRPKYVPSANIMYFEPKDAKEKIE